MKSLTDNRIASRSRGMYAIPVSDYIETAVLSAGVPQTFIIPPDGKIIIFSLSSDFYIMWGTDASVVATIPTASSNDGNSSEYNPSSRSIPDGMTHYSLVSPTDCMGTLSFFKW